MASDQTVENQQKLEKELLSFLTLESRVDVKSVAMRYVLEMTGSEDGRKLISEGDKFLPTVFSLTNDSDKLIRKDAYLAAVNLSADEAVGSKIMSSCPSAMLEMVSKLLKTDFSFADEACCIVSNITRLPENAQVLAAQILEPESTSDVSMEKMVNALCVIGYNKTASLHYLGTILSNLAQVSAIRKAILDKEQCIIQKLLPFTEYKDSSIRRGGIIGTLKNCCFEYDNHEWLLSEEVDIVSRLLLPLAGGEEFDDDEMDKLPVDLQYLPPDKEREEDPDLRIMLLEAITLLCSTKQGRLRIKDMNAYLILREHHKWEKDPKAKLACQKLCEMLISDEPAQDMEELHKVEVPADLEEKFNQMDLELLQDFETEQQENDDEGGKKG